MKSVRIDIRILITHSFDLYDTCSDSIIEYVGAQIGDFNTNESVTKPIVQHIIS